jgi:hypothetical protein
MPDDEMILDSDFAAKMALMKFSRVSMCQDIFCEWFFILMRIVRL